MLYLNLLFDEWIETCGICDKVKNSSNIYGFKLYFLIAYKRMNTIIFQTVGVHLNLLRSFSDRHKRRNKRYHRSFNPSRPHNSSVWPGHQNLHKFALLFMYLFTYLFVWSDIWWAVIAILLVFFKLPWQVNFSLWDKVKLNNKNKI